MFKEVMASTAFAMWPSIALVIFTVFLLGVIAWVYRPGTRELYARIKSEPFKLEGGERE